MKKIFLPEHIKLVGNPQISSWSQAFAFFENPISEKISAGFLFGVIALETKGEEEATIKGQQALSFLIEKFQKNSYPNRLIKLKQIVTEVKKEMDLENLKTALAYFFQNVLYLCRSEGTKILLYRDQSLQTLLPQNTLKETFRLASGFVKENDLYILQSSQFEEIISSDKLTESLNHPKLEEISDTLAPLIINASDSSRAAAVFIKIKTKELIEENEEIEPVIIEPIEKRETEEQKTKTSETFSSPLRNIYQNIFSHLPKRSNMSIFKRRDWKFKKNIAILSFFLFLILGIAVFTGYKSQQEKNRLLKFSQKVNSFSQKINEAKSKIESNPNQAREILIKAQEEIKKELKNNSFNSTQRQKLISLENETAKTLQLSRKVYSVKTELFYDLEVIKEGASGSKMAVSGKKAVILDNKSSTVYLIDLERKSGEIIAGGPDLKGVSQITLDEKNLYSLVPKNGIFRTNVESITKEKVINYDKNWGEIKDFKSFAGNLYLLDSKNSKIWKYVPAEKGFSKIKNYFTEETKPDLSEAQSLAIDGFIYVFLEKGEILKFTQGKIDQFILSGLENPFSKSCKLYTSEKDDFLYILDPPNRRIVLLNKDGSYKMQYEAEKVKEALDFAPVVSLNKIFLLTLNQIYTLNLR